VAIGPNAPQQLDLMLLPKHGTFQFAHAQWGDVVAMKPLFAKIFAAGVGGNARDGYEQLMEDHPDRLACLLNLTTAMQQISLPKGTPLGYFRNFDIPNLAADRIFGYADAQLVDQVRLAAQQGEFDTEPAIDLALHGDATSSFKQISSAKQTFSSRFMKRTGKRSTASIASMWNPTSIITETPPRTCCLKSFPMD
jgi:hypothetical protein